MNRYKTDAEKQAYLDGVAAALPNKYKTRPLVEVALSKCPDDATLEVVRHQLTKDGII